MQLTRQETEHGLVEQRRVFPHRVMIGSGKINSEASHVFREQMAIQRLGAGVQGVILEPLLTLWTYLKATHYSVRYDIPQRVVRRHRPHCCPGRSLCSRV